MSKAKTRNPVAPTKAAFVRARIDARLKGEAEAILGKLGLSASDAIRLLYSQITLWDGLPFPVKIPNPETIRALREADADRLNHYEDEGKLFEKLGL